MALSGLGLRIVHPAGCPDENPVWCEQPHEPVPDYLHDQGILWGRADAGLVVGLGEGWQAAVAVPFDVRRLTIDYRSDGKPYEPPGELTIHHRDETLWGPSDGRLWIRRYVIASREITVGGGLGSTLPFGHTEEDPYQLTDRGEAHQHFQLGSGTFDPVASGLLMWTGARWGALLSFDARVPLYANGKGYRPPVQGTLGAGPSYRVHPKVQLFTTADALLEGAERWHGDAYGGRTAVIGGAGAIWAPKPTLALQAQARTTLVQRMHGSDGDEAVRQRLVVTLGATFTRERQNGEAEEPE